MGKSNITTKCRSISPLVRRLFMIIEEQMQDHKHNSMHAVAKANRLSNRVLWAWKRGENLPNLFTFESILDYLGYELVIRKKQDAPQTNASDDGVPAESHGTVREPRDQQLLHGYA